LNRQSISGRRIKKNVVGSYIVKYVYDGDHVIAEYDDSGLLRKYIYGAHEGAASSESRKSGTSLGMDTRQSADNNKAYYYHFDGLGSVVALSNSNGDSCQSYEYSAYGQVAASDPNFLTNPYMFTGRRFDIETGLYYYRARYYNPHIGRFLQTDPVGYTDGINWYLYCRNNPLRWVVPSGYKTIDGPVKALRLMWHYLTGEGDELAYIGEEAWSFAYDDFMVGVQIEDAMEGYVSEWLDQYDPCDPSKNSGSFFVGFGVEFATIQAGGSLANHLVHNATVVAGGTWTIDEYGEGITLDLNYTLLDVADLHPGKFGPDTVSVAVTEFGWDIGLNNYIDRTPLDWLIEVPDAQPYLLSISSGQMTEDWTIRTIGTEQIAIVVYRDSSEYQE